MNRISALLLAGVAAVAVSSAAHAADLIINEPAPVVGVVDQTGNWDGAFVGVFAGTAWGTASNDPDVYNYVNNDDFDVDGWLAGVDAGVNFHLADGIVAGIVGDIAWTDLAGSAIDSNVLVNNDEFALGVNWQGSVRGRLGFDGGAFMPYLTAGIAFANATLTDDYTDTNDSQTLVGWTAGAGVEFAATDNVSIDLQYRYNDYGNADFDLNGTTANVGLTSQQITAGLHFRF